MASSTSPNLSSSPDPQQWLHQITKILNDYLLVNTDFPICIFHLPQTLTSQNPNSYIPQVIGLGPIHHFHSDLYSKQEQLKLTTARTLLKPYKITVNFQTLIVDRLKPLVPEARCHYDELYLDLDDDALAWVFAIDGLFLLDVLTKMSQGAETEYFADVTKMENQIPLVVLIEIQNALDQRSTGDLKDSFLTDLFVKFCETRTPLKFNREITQFDLDITSRLHLLDCMYHLIVNDRDGTHNPYLRISLLGDIELEDVENAVQMAGGVCPGANVFLQPLLLLLKLPWQKIIDFVKKMLGEKPALLEIDIPSASQLSSIGKIEFSVTRGGIRGIKFDDKTSTFYLPVLSLKPDCEVLLRNLVAYETLMAKKGNIVSPMFTEYVDLMCGIINTVKDVSVLRYKKIIEGDMSNEEIAKLFNRIAKSNMKTDENSELHKTVVKVNKHFGSKRMVKAYQFIKKHVLGSWKILVIVFTLVNVLLLMVQGVCQVYDCSGHFGLGDLRFVLTRATNKNQLVDF